MSARKSQRKKPVKGARNRRARLLFWVLGAGFFVAAAALLGLVSVLAYFGRDLPPVQRVADYAPAQTTRVFDRKGRLISEVFQERRTVVPLERMPRVLVLSVIAAEDADFYHHRGLDYAGILRALARDVWRGRPAQGASTITQQLVKNLLLTPERTLERKVKELILARRLEQELSKDEILHLYLNHINFGHGRYGVQEAARFYFGKDVSKLDLNESSMLAGLPQAPGRLSPLTHPEAARQRQLYVLDQLAQKRAQYWDDLPIAEIEQARKAPPKVARHDPSSDLAPEAATAARDILLAAVGEKAFEHGGYRVETTIDLDLQAMARAALRAGLSELDARKKLQGPLSDTRPKQPDHPKQLLVGRTYDAVVTSTNDAVREIRLRVGRHPVRVSLPKDLRENPKNLLPSQLAPNGSWTRVAIDSLGQGDTAEGRLAIGPQGAVVVLDPRTRDVLALVGGDTAAHGFNRALQALRQPGSTWKPITFALAIDSSAFTPASLVLDAPEVFDKWKPGNYETWSYAGSVRLREALAQSINLVAVRVMNELTPAKVVDFARALGITSPLDPSLALALGASEVRPIELVNAYATFAAGGRYAPYNLVRSIRDAKGKSISPRRRDASKQVMSPASAYVLTSMLRSVIQTGTGQAAKKLGRPAAGKTGTSNQARDAWFVGYSPELVVGVWVGYDDHRPLGKGESGSRSALPIWLEVMQKALEGRPEVEFPVPSGIERAQIDPESGLLAYDGMPEAIEEVFIAGTAPVEVAKPKDVLESADFMMQQLNPQ